MRPETVGLLGAIIGSVIGLLGGIAGAWFAIRNARGPRERAWVIRASLVAVVMVASFVAAMLLIPVPLRYWLWLPYAAILPLSIRAWNRKLSMIGQEESGGRA